LSDRAREWIVRISTAVFASPFFWGSYLLFEQGRIGDGSIAGGLGIALAGFAVFAPKAWVFAMWPSREGETRK